MSAIIKKFPIANEVTLARNVALHALEEYRLWRNNNFIGEHLGPVRCAYVGILRRRVRDALEAYKLVRAQAAKRQLRTA